MKTSFVFIVLLFIAACSGTSPKHTVDDADGEVTDSSSDEDAAEVTDIAADNEEVADADIIEKEDSTDDFDIINDNAADEDIFDDNTFDEDFTDDSIVDENLIDEDLIDKDVIDEDTIDEDLIDEDIIDEDTVPQDPPVKNLYGNQALYCVAYEGSTNLECGGVSADQLYAAHSIPYGEVITVAIDPESIVKATATTYSISFLLTDGTLKVWGVPDEKWPNGATEMPLREASMKLKNIWQVSPTRVFGVRVDDDELVQWGTGYMFYDMYVSMSSALPVYSRDPESGHTWSSITGVTDAGSDCIGSDTYGGCNRSNRYGNNARNVDLITVSGVKYLKSRTSDHVPNKGTYVPSYTRYLTNSQCGWSFKYGVYCYGLAPIDEILWTSPEASIFSNMHSDQKVEFTVTEHMNFASPIPLINGSHLQLMYTATEMWTFVRGSFAYETGMGPVEPLVFPFGNIKGVFDGIKESWMILTTDGEVWSLKAETKEFKRIQLPYSAKTW